MWKEQQVCKTPVWLQQRSLSIVTQWSCNSNFAGRGAAFDYTITGRMVSIEPGKNTFATVTIRVDGVALEPDETFQLKLVASQPPRVFCLDTLDLVIEDGDGIYII